MTDIDVYIKSMHINLKLSEDKNDNWTIIAKFYLKKLREKSFCIQNEFKEYFKH